MRVKKQIVGRNCSLGFIFSLKLLDQMSDFVNFFLIPNILKLLLRLKGAIFGIVFKNKQNIFNFFFAILKNMVKFLPIFTKN